MANTACSINIPVISSAFISLEGNEILSAIKAPRYVDYINYLFGNVFKREYLNNASYLTLADFTDDSGKISLAGSLNNLYRKVEEELQNQLQSGAILALPESTKEDLKKILDNWILFKNFHSKYNNYILVRPEDLEEKQENSFDKRSNEHTEYQLLTSQIRTLFKLLPQTQMVKNSSTGELEPAPNINPVDGLPIRGDFENIFKLTLDALKGIKDQKKFIEKLTSNELLSKVPELNYLLQILPVSNENGTSLLNNKQKFLFHEFYLSMSREYIPAEGCKITKQDDSLPEHMRFQSARGNIAKIKNQFVGNFISSREENEYVKIHDYIDGKNPERSVYGRKLLYNLPKRPEFIDLSVEEMNALTPRKIKSQFKEHLDFFKLLGIEFSDFLLIPNKRDLINVLNSSITIHDNLLERLKAKKALYSPIEDLEKQDSYINEKNVPVRIKSLKNVIKSIIKFEGTISKISPTLVTKTAENKNQSDITYPNTITISAREINEATSLDDLYTKPSFKKLKYNPLHKGSFVGSRIIGNRNIKYSVINYSSNTVEINTDKADFDTKNLTDVLKFRFDFSNLLGWGVINTPQLEAKSSYFAIKFVDETSGRNILPFAHSMFTKDFITKSDFTSQITNYIRGEVDRIKLYKRVTNFVPASYGEFHMFKGMLSQENRSNILKDRESEDYKKAEQEILDNVNAYFNNELTILENFIKDNDIEDLVTNSVLRSVGLSEQVFNENKEAYTKSLLRTFIANSFIHNVEFGIFISGDPLFFPKDYHKRLGGVASTGTDAYPTDNLRELFNSDSEKLYWENFSLRGIMNQVLSEGVERRDNFDTYLSAVLKEDNVKENTEYQKKSTIENYIYSVKLNSGRDINEEKAIEDLKIKDISEKGIDIADGQAYLNLDMHRELSIKQGTYRPQQDVSYKLEALIFKQMLLQDKGKDLSEDEIKLVNKLKAQIFSDPSKYGIPTLKQTYYGTLSNSSVEVDAKVFDKFSLATLLPSTAKNHPKLKALLLAMAKRQISYVKYKSGTKGFVREQFKNIEDIANENNELDEQESSLLKLQITPPKTEKTSVKLLTQQVKLLFTNLFDKGESTDNVAKLRDKFISDLNNIKTYNRKNVLENLGFKTDESGKITSWDKVKVVESLVSQVNLQKLPNNVLESLELDSSGNFVNSIESSMIYQQLIKYVVGKLDSSLREFKINGSDFVLISESMFSNPLKYFRLNKDKTKILPCEARITLTKEYLKLLDLPDPNDSTKTIGDIERLNELVKSEEFRNKYEKELTIILSRPPVQGPNSMGTAIIIEFFYPTAGNILQLPKEFMHQSGIDFDYDKERVLIPSLSNLGTFEIDSTVTNKINALEAEYQELRDIYDHYEDYIDPEEAEDYEEYNNLRNQLLSNDRSTEFLSKLFGIDIKNIPDKLQEIDEKLNEYFKLRQKEKSLLSNSLFTSMKDSLQQVELYSELILPNTNETVRPLAISNGEDINNLNVLPTGMSVYSYFNNLRVFNLFNSAKTMIGPFALHNVFLELIAPLNISINLDYSLNKDNKPTLKVNRLLLDNTKRSERIVNISSKYDAKGNVKQHITSEFINATVDSAKDPYFANFMLSLNNISVFSFLLTIDYPADLAVDFVSSAVVREYLRLKNTGLNKNEALSEVIRRIAPKEYKTDPKIENFLQYDEVNLDKDNTGLLENLKRLKSNDALDDRDMYLYNVALLSNYVAMEIHAKQLTKFKSIFKNDTDKTASSLFELNAMENSRANLISAGMFSKEAIEKVEKNSTMTAFRNDDLVSEVLKQIFPLISNPVVTKGLSELFNSTKFNLSELDNRVLSQVITNDYITSILFSFGTYKNTNFFLYARDLVSKEKKIDGTVNTNLPERLYSFKKNKAYPDLIKQFPVLEKILIDVSKNRIKNNQVYYGKYAFNVLLNIDDDTPIIEKEAYMNQFKQIVEGDFTTEDPKIKEALINLTKDFFIAGLVQSGFNTGGISFLEYTPIKFLQSLLNPALSNYNNVTSKDQKFLGDYVNLFNVMFKYNNSRFFYFKKDEVSLIVRDTHLGKFLYVSVNYGESNNVNIPIKKSESISNVSEPITSMSELVNHSGGAYGADTEWDIIGRTFGVTDHRHYREENNSNLSKRLRDSGIKAKTITPEQLEEGYTELEKVTGKKYERNLENNLKARNLFQVKNADAIYAIAQLSGKGVKGGTNAAIQMAIEAKKPIYVWDLTTKEWYKWSGNEFEQTKTPILTKNFAGIGSRNIEDYNTLNKKTNKWESRKEYVGKELSNAAKQAIKDVYQKTKDSLSNKQQNDNLTQSNTINIYSTDKNGFNELSNLLNGPIKIGDFSYKTVEHLFQWKKAEYFGDAKTANQIFNAETGFEAQKLGKKVKNFDAKRWDEVSSKILEDSMRLAFTQNEKAKELLLSTGNKELTHKATINLGKWETEFPRILTKLRDEFRKEETPGDISVPDKVEPINQENQFVENISKDINQINNIVEYSGRGFIVENTEDDYIKAYYVKQGEKGAEVTDKNLLYKISVANDVKNNPKNVVILEDMQGSPKYYFTEMGEVISLQETSYGKQITSEDVYNRVFEAYNRNITNNSFPENKEQLQPILPKDIKTFSYKGKTIETEFQLGEQQEEALKTLIDFATSGENVITLQGAAGTGKTTIIGYLQKYLGKNSSFAYMAPTHAATAELAFATVKTGSKVLPSTLQSSLTQNFKSKKYVFSQKIQKRLGYNPIVVLDESSMIDQVDTNRLLEAINDIGGKIIYLGDEKQISKVQKGDQKTKLVSPVFTKNKQVILTKIYRQSDNSLLNLLGLMREQTDFKLFKVENSDAVKFVDKKGFSSELFKDLAINPENTVVITYTNASVQGTNQKIRQILGRTGETVVGDIVIGYLGYASKQIENQDIANSISYIITDIKKEDSKRKITATSSKLKKLIDLGIQNLDSEATTYYYQMSNSDSLTFDDLTQEDYNKNNVLVSEVFRDIHSVNNSYANKHINYQTYLSILAGLTLKLAKYSVGDDYIYNPASGKMEKYDFNKHQGIKADGQGSLLFNKDIDYGHAITIHKSQGSTIDNVYFDSNSLNSARNTPIVDDKGIQITTEKMSLAYVAMSRSKNKLVVYEGDNYFEMIGDTSSKIINKNLEDIGFNKTCE